MIRKLLCWLGFHKWEVFPTLWNKLYNQGLDLGFDMRSSGVFFLDEVKCKHCGKIKKFNKIYEARKDD